MELIKSIKSVRVYVEGDNIIKLDYRVKQTAKLPKGRKGFRFRTSTGEKSTPQALKSIEKNKFKLAAEHYESLFNNLENKEEPLFEDIAELALEEAEVNRTKTDATLDYQNILKNDVLPTFGKLNLADIKVKDIRAWMITMSKQKLSQSRFNKKYYVLKRVLDYALENEYIISNPISLVQRSSKLFTKAKDKSNDYFSKGEMSKILNDTCENGTPHDLKNYQFIRTFMHVALYTGARSGEIIALKKNDINFQDNTITFQRSIRRGIEAGTKTGRTRVVPMVKPLVDALKEWIADTNKVYLFPKPYTDKPYSTSRPVVDRYYRPMLQRLNIPFRILYNSRHTFASVAIENKIPIATVSRCLGHSTISTTERYYLQFGNADQNDIRSQLENLIA